MRIAVVIPTITGREESLAKTVRSYVVNSPDYDVHLEVVHDRPTCGLAWRDGTRRALRWDPDFIHMTCDDFQATPGWAEAAIGIVGQGGLPAALIKNETYGDRCFERGVTTMQAGEPGDYPMCPFFPREWWHELGPMITSHYATDKWFGRQAEMSGIPIIACPDCVIIHEMSQVGRYGNERVDFDCNIAYTAYVNGELDPADLHPEWNTAEGMRLAREWRRKNVGTDTSSGTSTARSQDARFDLCTH